MSLFPQHFEFRDWERAFLFVYSHKSNDESVHLVLCTHWAASGYWVELDAKPDAFSIIYRTLDDIKALESRIRERGDEVSHRTAEGKIVRRRECLNLGVLIT